MLRTVTMWLILLVVLAGTSRVMATEPGPWDGITVPLLVHLRRDQGLPNESAMALVQDADGLIWIGTQGGLVRWDGYRARAFLHDQADPHSLPGNYVTRLLVDEAHVLWVATDGGVVARYDRDRERFDLLPAIPQAAGVFANMVGDGNGGILVGNDKGLAHYVRTSQSWVQDPCAGLDDHRITGLLRDRSGTLWVGTDSGLARRSQETALFEPIGLLPAVAGTSRLRERVTALTQDAAGRIWFGRGDGRIGHVDTSQRAELNEGSSEHEEPITSLLEVQPGVLLAGTWGGGLLRLSQGGIPIRAWRSDPSSPSGLADNRVWAIMRDRAGLVWIATGKGVDRFDPNNRAIASLLPGGDPRSSLSGADVYAIHQHPSGQVWLGFFSGGVDIFDPYRGRVSSLPIRKDPAAPGLPVAAVSDFSPQDNGAMWIATSRGLYEKPARGDTVARFQPLGDEAVNALLKDGDTLWIGTRTHGLARLSEPERTLEFLSHRADAPDGLSDPWVVVMLKDPVHGLWVGTIHGLNLLAPDGHGFRQFLRDTGSANGLQSDMVLTLLRDGRQRLWIGTDGGGISIMEGDPQGQPVFRHLGAADGLPSDIVNVLLSDPAGRIWAGTSNGLAMIDPATLAIRSLGEVDGVAIRDYFWSGAGAVATDGSLLFGGGGGATVVHPDLRAPSSTMPPVVVTAIRIGGRSQPTLQPVVIKPEDRSLQVEFSALDYSAPERNRYAYRMSGFDDDWITSDSDHRLAAYTNLPPGRYTLLLRGSNREGAWSDPPVQLPVTVLPAWYQTGWFRLVEAALVGLGVTGLLWLRTAQLRQRRLELEREVTLRTEELAAVNAKLVHEIEERKQAEVELRSANQELDAFAHAVSHDLRAPLRAMTGFSAALEEDFADRLDGEARQYLGQIAVAGRHMGDLIEGLLSLSKAGKGDLQREDVDIGMVVAVMRRQLEAAEAGRQVSWSVEPGLHVWGDRRMVEVILDNLLSNAWKYTHGRDRPEIHVYAETLSGRPFICVADNGAGFDQKESERLFKPFQRLHRQEQFPGLGIGLSTVARVVHRHGGIILTSGAVGQGAVFKFHLPKGAESDKPGPDGARTRMPQEVVS
jgi:signal transduction histidine kinase/ligand-binding sensor domain-containing protein